MSARRPAQTTHVCTANSMTRILLLFLLACVSAHGATYYIDYVGGSDANNGTSTGTPWQRFPSDVNATGVSDGTTLVAGDTVIFKGGVTYVATANLPLNWSGSAGNPIIIDGNSAGTWGTGKAILTSNNVSIGFFTATAARSYLTFRNLHFFKIGGYAEDNAIWLTTTAVTSPPGGTGINFDAGGTGITVTDCKFEKIGQWINAIPMSGTLSITGTGVRFQRVINGVVSNCEFTKLRTGVELKVNVAYSGIIGPITVSNCDFHDSLVWGLDIAPRQPGTTLTGITIEDCRFYNYSQYDSGNWLGYGDKPHRDGIFMRTAGGAVGQDSIWTNIVVRRNTFWDDNAATSNGGTAGIYISQGPSVSIYNNLFLTDPFADGIISIGGTNLTAHAQRVTVANNTFLGPGRLRISASSNADVIDLRNNIFYRTTAAQNSAVLFEANNGVGTLVCDYNLYYADQSLAGWQAVNNGSGLTFVQWQALGYETNGILADPDVVSIAGASSTWDVRPSLGSPVIGAGADLSSIFTTDYIGNTRSSWDIGAYEYGAPASDETPPTAIASIPVAGTTLSLAFSEVCTAGAGGTTGVTLNAPSGAVTATYASGEGTPTWTYTLSRTVINAEVLTWSYSTANGIEDGAGNDIATVTNAAVTNLSLVSAPTSPPTNPKRRKLKLTIGHP
jgi:hypothetical protein